MVDHEPLARYAALSGFTEVCADLGLDADALLRRSGLDTASLGLPERWVRAADIAELLERAASVSGREDFGLRMAEVRRLANLGPLSMVIREEPDLRSALVSLIRHNHMYNESMRIRLLEEGGAATISVALQLGWPQPSQQSVVLAIGTLFRTVKELRGFAWEPRGVRFAHAKPGDMATYHRVFGPRVAFGHPEHSIVVRSADLDSPTILADPLMLSYARQFLVDRTGWQAATMVTRTRELIETLLPTGRCSASCSTAREQSWLSA